MLAGIEVRTQGCIVLQILKKKYDMAFLQPSWLGRRWQPWYQDLLDLAGIIGVLSLCISASWSADHNCYVGIFVLFHPTCIDMRLEAVLNYVTFTIPGACSP